MLKIVIARDANCIKSVVTTCNPDFIKPLAQKSDFESYIKKIIDNAIVLIAVKNDMPLGYIAFYANDSVAYTAYITLLAVDNEYQNQGVGHKLIKACEYYSKKNKMKYIKLEVKKYNETAIRFYDKNGFVRLDEHNENSFYMIKTLDEGNV